MSPESAKPTESVPDRIRAVIGPLHAAIETLPFAARLTSGQASRGEYGRVLAQLAHFHRWLEGAEGPSTSPAWEADMARNDAIQEDLKSLGVGAEAPWPSTQRLVAALSEWRRVHPAAALGALYVSEGSRLGGQIVGKRLAEGFGLEDNDHSGVRYQLAGGPGLGARWKAFRATIAACVAEGDAARAAVGAAESTMQGFHDIYEAASAGAPDLSPDAERADGAEDSQ